MFSHLLLTFDDELVMENPLQGSQEEHVERKIADFPCFEVTIDLFERLVALERLLQLFEN